MTKDEALKLALDALEYADACLKKQLTTKTKHEYAQDLLLGAGTAIKEALAQPAQEWSWVCNECGSSEFASVLSEADLEYLACAGCGCNEFHKEALAQPAQEPVAWGYRSKDGEIYDCISPEAHADAEGDYTVPLYTTPPKDQTACCAECGKTESDGWFLYCVDCMDKVTT